MESTYEGCNGRISAAVPHSPLPTKTASITITRHVSVCTLWLYLRGKQSLIIYEPLLENARLLKYPIVLKVIKQIAIMCSRIVTAIVLFLYFGYYLN